MSIRVYALARELGLDIAEMMNICAELGLVVKSGLNTLDEAQRALVTRRVKEGPAAVAPPPPPPVEPTPAPEAVPTPAPAAVESAAPAPPAQPEPAPVIQEAPLPSPPVPVMAETPPTAKKVVAPAAKPARPKAPAAPPPKGPKAGPVVKPKGKGPAKPPAGKPGPAGESLADLFGRAASGTRPAPPVAEEQPLRWQRLMPPEEGRAVRRPRFPRRERRPIGRSRPPSPAPRKEKVTLQGPVTVKNLSAALGIKASELIASLMSAGVMATINQEISDEAAMTVAMNYGIDLEVKRPLSPEERFKQLIQADKPEQLRPRPPIVTVLGHVDHGKTSLLDAIRKTNVTAQEAGGITQHIGASRVQRGDTWVTFLDTPGHAAFTAMRARGANVTDIVVLVVAADDGVMPQTEEAIAHAKAADVPILVAVNKIDKPEANVNRVYQQLAGHNLIPEEWGGDTIFVKTSAVTGQGIDSLLENLLVLAEVLELKANPDKPATGTCLEANLTAGRGVQATFLVQEGTLRVGDAVVCGRSAGRVRALFDERDQPLKEAGPSTPVVVVGLDQMPEAGDKFVSAPELEQAREIADLYGVSKAAGQEVSRPQITLENLFEHIRSGSLKELNLILKADARGSLEAIRQELSKLQHQEVKLRIIYEAVGAISESDVQLADASGAIIVGFQVSPDDRARALAESRGVEIRTYFVIYELADQIRAALEGLLEPETREVRTARLEVRETFRISRVGTIGGSYVREGTISRGDRVRLWRNNVAIYDGVLESLRRFKDDAAEVREGFECGVKIAGYDDIKVGDIIEAYRIEKVKRTL